MAHLRRRLAFLLALALPLQACGSAAPAVRVRVPLEQNPGGDLAAERCVLDCQSRSDRHSAKYAECISTCPGAEVEAGLRCGADDRAPWAACAESNRDLDAEFEPADAPRDASVADAVGAGLAVASLLLDVASLAAKKGGGGRSKSKGKSSGGHHRASSSKGHVSASPSKESSSSGHRLAKPSSN
jgi:hypothetical protein